MERVVNPRSIDRTLLLSQHEHKSELLWKGEKPFSNLMRTWQRDTTSASHGEEVSQFVKDTLLEAGIQFSEPFFEGDPLFEHVRARGPRRGRMGHRGRARGRALGRGAGGIPIPPDIEAGIDSR
uniref:Uncharacterized protein n=1 Tax=Solanum lycopersicum TaxID=4081 RepID=A0A3Q7H8Z1_SOLLC